MTVHFIGAGPGAPDLITVRGLDLIRAAPVVLYAGSLVPAEVVAEASDDARVLDTAPMNLDEIIAETESALRASLKDEADKAAQDRDTRFAALTAQLEQAAADLGDAKTDRHSLADLLDQLSAGLRNSN